MTYEPSDVMVEAAAKALTGHKQDTPYDYARAALRAAFAAAIEADEAREAAGRKWSDKSWTADSAEVEEWPYDFPALILRSKPQQEGEK